MAAGTVSGHSAQRGLTLIELMVSVAIGMVVVGAVTYLYVGSKGAYRGNESQARIQEAGRFALDAMTRDVRRTGALGCGSLASVATTGQVNVTVVPPSTTTVDPTRLLVDTVSGQPIRIQGFSPAAYTPLPATAPTGWTPPAGAPAYWGGDVLQLQIAGGLPARMSASPDTAAGNITIATNALPNSTALNFNQNDYALVADCSSAAIFKVSSAPTVTTAPTTLLSYVSGGGVPALPTISLNSFPTVQHFDQVTYYLGKLPAAVSPAFPKAALYRYSLVTGVADEVAGNVEDMDIVYGVDTGGTGAAGTFYHAPNVPDWTKVISVRVSIVAIGDQQGAALPGQPVALRGTDPNPVPTSAPAGDTRLRQVFTATAVLRDRIQ